jgi:hypothetical protein
MFRLPATRSDDPNPDGDRDPSVAARVVRIVLIMGGVLGAIVAAVAITLPGGGHRSDATVQASPAAQRTAANKQWASATCTNILAWKNEIARDQTGLLSLGALTRINDAITATKRMLKQQDKLGLPPGAQTAQARGEASRLRTEIEARVKNIESAAGSVAGGNITALGTLVTDLENDKAMAPQVVDELRHVLTVDLGLSLAETKACRQLVGIPI